ncbi:hypothetical protein [Mucilaginibacter sp. PAMB04168]|uniref:hypothetical protein n=1 Tax=Mucilaginibacter sp. PAMB04168 TaxID=3138567 RepID=UPI0031F634EB
MKVQIFTFLSVLFVVGFSAKAQKKDVNAIADSIQQEAKRIYNSEMASWHGTDIFLAKLKHKQAQIGGYISYDAGNSVKNVFFSKGDSPDVLSTITFDYSFDLNNYKIDTIARKLTTAENELVVLRSKAIETSKTDTSFKRYQNTNLNFIPLIYNGFKRVYILTGPTVSNVIVFGNDYLIEFDQSNNILSKKKLHRNILPMQTKHGDGQTAGVHNHQPETGDFITATDVCTLMLYKNITDWKTHYVLSKNYVSSWDMAKGGMVVLTMDAWKRIANDTAGKKPAN